MGKAYKNFWSLNADEAVAVGIFRDETEKEVEIFIPMNAQMKGIDLICVNTKNKKILTIQVKGSKAYEPAKERERVERRVKKIGGDTSDGSSGWFWLKKDDIVRSEADYFVFLGSVITTRLKAGRRVIEPHTILIPTKNLRKLVKIYKRIHGKDRYSFYFWINPKKRIAFDWRDRPYMVNEYLDIKGFERLNRDLK